ncbi:MAG: TIR domain-containing protein, partial [Lysobacterales bacterium]
MIAVEPAAGFRYWAFISYSHQDQSWGRWLHRALETYRVPRRLVGMPIAAGTIPPRLSPVFRDRDELPTATDLDRTVAEALRQSWCLIVICSPAAAQSRWVNEEVREFQRLGHADRIHCLIVDGAADDADTACFPSALRLQPDDGTAAREPIAADARRSGDGKSHARLKLVAGILGISYDRLVHREQQRSYRRVFAIACAAVLAFSVLAVFTFITITSRRDAEAQRGHAEGLIEFMLGDLRSKLEPEGKLSTLDAVGKEALSYYAAQDPASLDADALARRARALHLLGDVYDQRGRLDDALGVFKQASATTAELLAREPQNAQRIFDHAQSVFYVGQIAWRRGQVKAAETAFDNYKELATRLVGIDPGNADWQAEVEYADSNLGTLLLDQGRRDDAAAAFERALAVATALNRRAPNDDARRSELAQAYAWLADARVAQGRFADAVVQRQAEVAICEEILAVNPKNYAAKSALQVAERELGEISLMRGDVPMALSQLRRAIKLVDELVAADPENVATAHNVASAYAVFGEAAYDGGDVAAARTAIAHSRDIAAPLVQRDPSVVEWQAQLSRSLLLQARLSAADGDALGALRQIQGVLQRLDTMRDSNRPDQRTRLLYARASLMAGEQDQALGNRAE